MRPELRLVSHPICETGWARIGLAIRNLRLRVSLICRSRDYSVPFSRNFWHSSVWFVAHSEYGFSAVRKSNTQLDPTRWRRSASSPRDLLCVDEQCKHSAARFKDPYLKGLPHQLVNSLVWNGQIFFAVFGFLITSTTLRRWGSLAQVSLRDFYLLRFARIASL